MSNIVTIAKAMAPPLLKRTVRRYREAAKVRRMFGRLAPMVPPEKLMHDGPPTYEAFRQNSDEYFKIYRDVAGLQPHEKILDVGCGIGRKTILLTQYLNKDGVYLGFDIVRSGIEWCSRAITTRYPNFRFQTVDVYNKSYNPTGKVLARDYRFPLDDQSFDLVVLGSVFTHMLPMDVDNYLAEIRRVLKPRGRCLISWFLLNPESQALIDAGESSQLMVYEVERGCRTVSPDPDNPEGCLGYEEQYVLALYRKHGFRDEIAIHYGSWCGRPNFLTYQDIIIAHTG
jgi:ubiquinone/menaquinone biosynthesis C-methylase UbiE